MGRQDYNAIMNETCFELSNGEHERILQHDCIFWMGDLNFRLECSHPDFKKRVLEAIEKNEAAHLLVFDQLNQGTKITKVFEFFKEATINFNPTFKFKKKTQKYNPKSALLALKHAMGTKACHWAFRHVIWDKDMQTKNRDTKLDQRNYRRTN